MCSFISKRDIWTFPDNFCIYPDSITIECIHVFVFTVLGFLRFRVVVVMPWLSVSLPLIGI
jgi:hypothetical protein